MLFPLLGTHNKAFFIHDFSAWGDFPCKPQSTHCLSVLSRYLPYIVPILSPHPSTHVLSPQFRDKEQKAEQKKPGRQQECYTAGAALQSHKPRPTKNTKGTPRYRVFPLIKSEALTLQ